jgi:hypothetical protein
MPNDLEKQKREREKKHKEEMRAQQEKYRAELNQKSIDYKKDANEAKYNQIPFKNRDIDRMEARKRKPF